MRLLLPTLAENADLPRRNRFSRSSKLDEERFLQILNQFCLDAPASACAAVTRVSVRSVNQIYVDLRVRMIEHSVTFPEAFGGSGRSLANLLTRRGIDSFESGAAPDALLYEFVRCIGPELAERISARGLRRRWYRAHAFELFLRKKSDPALKKRFLNVDDGRDPRVMAAVKALKEGRSNEFRKAVARLPVPPMVSDSQSSFYPSLYDELIDILLEDPL